MAKSAKKRYNTTDDMLEDLRAVARGEPPTIARKLVDLSSLTALEPDDTQVLAVRQDASQAKPLTEQPLFWTVLAEGAIIVLLLAVLVLSLSG